MARRRFKSEQEVNDFYDEKRRTTEARYERRTEEISASIAKTDNRILTITEGYPTRIEKINFKIQKSDERIAFLESSLYITSDEEIEQIEEELERIDIEIKESIDIGQAPSLNTVLRQEKLLEQRKQLIKSTSKERRINQDIKDEIVSVERTQEEQIEAQKTIADNTTKNIEALEAKRDELIQKQNTLGVKLEEDLVEIERKREDALEKLPKGVPAKTLDIEFFTYGKVSSGSDRYVTVKVKAEVTVPADYTESDVLKQDRYMLELCEKAWQYIDETENVRANVDISYELSRPNSRGIYHYDQRLSLEYSATDEIFIPDGFVFKNNEYIEEE